MFPTQVEIKLAKATAGQWESLERKEDAASSQRVYPSSHQRDPVDWDKVEQDVSSEAMLQTAVQHLHPYNAANCSLASTSI